MILSRIFKALFILSIFPLTSPAAVSHCPMDSTFFSTRRYGPFALLNNSGDTVLVFVEVGRVHLDSAEYGGGWLETDYSHTFLDKRGNVLCRSVSRCEYTDGSTSIGAAQLVVPQVGPLILLMSQTVPSAPPTYTDGTLYGLDKFGHLVPFSANMMACGPMEAETFRPVLIKADGGRAISGDYSTDKQGEPAIEIEECENNFSIFRLMPIWWTRSSPAVYYQAKFRIHVDTEDVAGSRARYRQYNTDTLVTVYREPKKDNASATTLALRVDSSIKFIDAVDREGLWAHLVIDGVEGFVAVHDFGKLGLSDW
jgi:hypothetical protein